MAQDKVDKLKKLAEVAIEIVNGGGFTNKEAAQFFATLVKQVNEAKDSIRAELDKANSGLYRIIEKSRISVESRVDADITRLTSKLDNIPDIQELIFDLKKEIAEIDNKIEPFPDLSVIGDELLERVEKQLPQFGEVFRDGLELLKDGKRLEMSAIKGLEDELEAIRAVKSASSGGGHSIVGRDIISKIDISDQLNGVTKTFNLQAIYSVVSVSLSSYPYGTLRPDIDYTFTDTSITFTSTIVADAQLATGQQCIIIAVLG